MFQIFVVMPVNHFENFLIHAVGIPNFMIRCSDLHSKFGERSSGRLARAFIGWRCLPLFLILFENAALKSSEPVSLKIVVYVEVVVQNRE